jgi:predicted small metal-binding protein
MEKFACKNVGIGCDFEVTAATKEETLKKAMDHGGDVHANLMVGQSEEEQARFMDVIVASIEPV